MQGAAQSDRAVSRNHARSRTSGRSSTATLGAPNGFLSPSLIGLNDTARETSPNWIMLEDSTFQFQGPRRESSPSCARLCAPAPSSGDVTIDSCQRKHHDRVHAHIPLGSSAANVWRKDQSMPARQVPRGRTRLLFGGANGLPQLAVLRFRYQDSLCKVPR